MTVERFNNYNTNPLAGTSVPANGAVNTSNTSNPLPLVNKSVVENSSINSFGNSGTTVVTENSNCVSAKELDNALIPLFQKYGADWNTIKPQMLEIFRKMNPLYTNSMDKTVSIPITALEKITKEFTNILETLKSQNLEINVENILLVHDNKVLARTNSMFSGKTKITFNIVEENGLVGEFILITGIHPKELQNLPANEVEAALKAWQDAYSELSANGNFTARQLRDRANNYVILGDDREKYQKRVEKGEVKSLRELLNIEEGQPITEQSIVDMMNQQNTIMQQKIAQETDPVKKAQLINQLLEEQDYWFKEIIVATEREDRGILVHTIKHLFADNKSNLLNTLWSSIDEDTRIELANTIFRSEKNIKEIFGVPDFTGKSCDVTKGVATIVPYQTKETIEKVHAEMISEAEAFIRAYEEALKNGKEISPEDQAKYDYYIDRQGGEQIATANHFYMKENEIKGLLEVMNEDAYSISPTAYRDVVETITEYVNEHPEVLTMEQEEFTALMDEVTNGNYSIVVKDVQNGTTTELNPPAERKYAEYTTAKPLSETKSTSHNRNIGSSSSEYSSGRESSTTGGYSYSSYYSSGSSNWGIGFNQTSTPVDLNSATNLTNQLYQNNDIEVTAEAETPTTFTPNTPWNFVKAAQGSLKAMKTFASEHSIGSVQLTTDILSVGSGIASTVKDWALERFSHFSGGIQVDICNNITDNNNKIEAASLMNLSDLQKVDCTSKYVQNNLEKIEEKKREQLGKEPQHLLT